MERQHDEAALLREQLDELLAQAHRNQQTLQRFSEQELQLIGITSLGELMSHLLHRLPLAFGVETVSLLLLDEEGDITRLLALDPLPSLQFPALMVERSRERLDVLYPELRAPQLAPYSTTAHGALFPGVAPLHSLALLPLLRSGRLIGSLQLGSRDGERFCAGSATDFLQHFAAIIAVCLENCLNHARLQQVGLTDALTGVSNRRYFEQRLGEAVAAALRHRRPLACLFIDVDHFKRINDEWGHAAGDEVLRVIAALIAGQLRHSDVFCRYGGEEFVVLLPDTDRGAALEIAERIRLASECHPFAIPVTVTVSAGVAALEDGDGAHELEQQAQQLVAAADGALYRAKAQGRNRVACAEQADGSDGGVRIQTGAATDNKK